MARAATLRHLITVVTACLGPAIVWHSLGLAAHINWHDVFDNAPLHYTDYATHYAQTDAVCSFLVNAGRVWGYSPFFLAGYPAGTIFDIDNKAIALASCAIHLAGPSLAHAFNVTVLALIALSPFAVFAAALVAGLGPAKAAIAQILGLAFWYGDPTINWMWRGSILAFLSASCGSLLVAVSFWRWATAVCDDQAGRPGGRRQSRGGFWVAGGLWFVAGPLLFWMHAFSFLLLLVPMLVGLLAVWTDLGWRARLVPVAWAAWVIALNLPWLAPFARFFDSRSSSAHFLQGGVGQLAIDLFTPHFPFRLLVVGLAVAGLRIWRRGGRHGAHVSWRSVTTSITVWLAVAYLGVHVGLADLQPYRFVAPALIFATLPAAEAIAAMATASPRHAAAVVTGLCLAAGWPLSVAWPRGVSRQADGTIAIPMGGPSQDEHRICEALRSLDLSSGRVLANDFRLGAYLPICSSAQVIGGPFTPVPMTYGYANAGFTTPGVDLFLGQPVADTDESQMEAMLDQYNVRWGVFNRRVGGTRYTFDHWAQAHPALFQPIATHGPFRLYAVNQPSSWFSRGTGRVTAEYDRLVVSDASPGGVVIKYHWMTSLQVRPISLSVRPVFVAPDPVPFISVENGDVREFIILHGRY